MRSLLSVLLVPAAVYAGFVVLMFLTQRSHIYFPVGESANPGAESLRFPVDGASLKVWAVRRPGPKALIYFGGNAEDVGASLSAFAADFPAHSLFLVNYRGYGGSTGRPSEDALVADAIALHDHLRSEFSEISVIGRSLGSGVAVGLASARAVHRLALVTPFDSLVNVAQSHFPYLPVGMILRDRYESARRVPAVKSETLVIVAGEDEIIPRARTNALVAAFPAEQVRIIVLDGAMHNEIDLRPEYREALRGFLDH